MTCFNSKAMPTNDNNYSCHKSCSTCFNQSYGVYIIPLVINSFGADTHTYTIKHAYQLPEFKKPGQRTPDMAKAIHRNGVEYLGGIQLLSPTLEQLRYRLNYLFAYHHKISQITFYCLGSRLHSLINMTLHLMIHRLVLQFKFNTHEGTVVKQFDVSSSVVIRGLSFIYCMTTNFSEANIWWLAKNLQLAEFYINLAKVCFLNPSCLLYKSYAYRVLYRYAPFLAPQNSFHMKIMETHMVESCVLGFHVYQDIWMPTTGDRLSCQTEDSNAFDHRLYI